MVGDNLDISWVNSQVAEFSDTRVRYKALSKFVTKILMSHVGEFAQHAMVASRVKTIASFTEKSIRQSGQISDPIRQLTDLCGARIIVHTSDQLDPVCKFLEKTFRID